MYRRGTIVDGQARPSTNGRQLEFVGWPFGGPARGLSLRHPATAEPPATVEGVLTLAIE